MGKHVIWNGCVGKEEEVCAGSLGLKSHWEHIPFSFLVAVDAEANAWHNFKISNING